MRIRHRERCVDMYLVEFGGQRGPRSFLEGRGVLNVNVAAARLVVVGVSRIVGKSVRDESASVVLRGRRGTVHKVHDYQDCIKAG